MLIKETMIKWKNSCKLKLKPGLKWIHLALIYIALRLLHDHDLEVMIVLILMYEIGFEFSAIDRLMEYNNHIRRWFLRKFSPRRKKV